jgi:hypothetical protein
VALAIVAAACAASAAHAQETVAAIRPSFSPDRLGARTAVTFGIHFAGGEEGVPAPVRKAVVQVPAGLGVELPSTLGCTVAHLQAHGASGCPPRSQIGSGHALMAVRTGAQVTREAATLWAFLGPLEGGQPTIQILGQGYTPIERRVAFSLRLEPDRAPFWAKLVALVPPIPTIPLEPDASAVNFSLTIGTTGRSRKPGTIGIFVPSHCPAGGFPWAAEFTYADGSTDNTTATIPCP